MHNDFQRFLAIYFSTGISWSCIDMLRCSAVLVGDRRAGAGMIGGSPQVGREREKNTPRSPYRSREVEEALEVLDGTAEAIVVTGVPRNRLPGTEQRWRMARGFFRILCIQRRG